jgi:glyoxylase-like metal-dependent hydrolase (beta-lactamase superfamily II)
MGFHPAVPDIILRDNMDIAGFKVIFSPGHTSGSICLYQPGKIIFVGDALKSDADGNPRPPSKTMSMDSTQAKRSLIAISKLEFDILLPGHGAPVKGGASAKLKGMIAQLRWDEETPPTKK